MKKGSNHTAKNRHLPGKSSWAQRRKTLGLVAITSLLAMTTACGQGATTNANSVNSTTATPSAIPSPTPSKVAGTACKSEKATQTSSGETYVCVVDRAGKLTWSDSATAKKLSDDRAAEAAAKAAAEKAAADKAAADKAAADKAAADQAAAAQAAADKAAADKAAADAAAAALVPKAVPAAPQAQSNCDPNYTGDCVPIASDVDCASGKGNGPAYVRGPVTVVGTDIYQLDGNGDGVGCEK
ncbi:hypothetical protein LN996_16520 [Arthrobacter sp. AK01]|uniref:hypothetical protein n=1 Tax=Arthrobacter sp. AK01 TaxID=2894084 RepID=UPI001E55F47A|nr:hypothetical protein [Arthrobacter sp. AK01]MCD4852420.1 hypothetical protein [Arthrobacter sp. AK01]